MQPVPSAGKHTAGMRLTGDEQCALSAGKLVTRAKKESFVTKICFMKHLLQENDEQMATTNSI